MLGSLVSILRYLCHNLGISDNATGAGNQQGRPDEQPANEHLKPEAQRAILEIAASMNDSGAYRRIDIASIAAHLEPSETVRQTSSK